MKTDDARSEDSDREKSMESLQDAIQEEMEENERMLKEKYGEVKVEKKYICNSHYSRMQKLNTSTQLMPKRSKWRNFLLRKDQISYSTQPLLHVSIYAMSSIKLGFSHVISFYRLQNFF